MIDVELPKAWVERVAGYPADGGPAGAEWVRTVPGRIREAARRWGLDLDGPPRTGWTAIVLPVRRDGEALALKVTWPHDDMRTEHLALRLWDGDGAVRLVAADPGAGLLLLERLDADRDLRTLPIDAACARAGELLARLHRPAPESLTAHAAYLAPHLERMATRERVPRRIRDRTLGLVRELSAAPGPSVVLHADLHYENVLYAADRGWVAIDPKPLRGHPGADLVPLLTNRRTDLDGRSFREAMRGRVAIAAEAARIDEDDALAWSLVMAGLEASWAVGMADEDALTHAIALTKALDA